LAQLVGLYRGLEQSITRIDREVAHWLARTPGAWLTSIPGFGITLAAGWTAELGPPSQTNNRDQSGKLRELKAPPSPSVQNRDLLNPDFRAQAEWRSVRQLCSYCGVVPKSKQTGGPDKEAIVGPVQQRSNKRLKNVVLQAVQKVIRYGPEELRRAAQELQARGAHTEFALAKRLVRLGKYLAVTGTVYRPKAMMDPDTPKATLAAHYQSLWEKLLPKWRDKADLRDVFAPEHPLGQWRKMVQELYALELRLPQQKAGPQSSALAP